jgi:hypothetical protein
VAAEPRAERGARGLSDLQLLTDSALARLDVDDLLLELLARVEDILDADTAAVLLLDKASGQLVARAARGIEEEVHQGVHIPLGTGFAGRIAASRRPVRLERVDHTTVANPILWQKGIRVMLGVPLLSGNDVLGVLHVGRLADQPFSEDDATLLQVVADRVAAATQARQLAVERAAATLLERSLLPGVLPSFPGLDVATRYVPSEHLVGGDWYDAFTVPSGEVWIVVGDVAGHGLQAAVVMGRIRSALRAYTLLGLPPQEVLELVDRKVDHFEMGTIATVACVVSAPPHDTLRIASAGHLPPVVARPGQPNALAPWAVDPPLGAGCDRRRTSTTLDFPPGAVLTLYTDGLVERRGEPIDAGLERLCRAVAIDSAHSVAQDVMRDLVGPTVPRDDIALVVVRHTHDR